MKAVHYRLFQERAFPTWREVTTGLEAAQGDALDHEPLLMTWFSAGFVDVFVAHKPREMAFLQDKDVSEIRRLYMDAY